MAEAQSSMDALSDRLRLPDHVRARARSLLHDQAAPSDGLKAAASAARGVTQPGRASASRSLRARRLGRPVLVLPAAPLTTSQELALLI